MEGPKQPKETTEHLCVTTAELTRLPQPPADSCLHRKSSVDKLKKPRLPQPPADSCLHRKRSVDAACCCALREYSTILWSFEFCVAQTY